MKLSDLIIELFEASEFTSANSLATYTGQTQPFVQNMLSTEKESIRKMDIVFDAMTEDVTVAELIAAIDLIKSVQAGMIERVQIL